VQEAGAGVVALSAIYADPIGELRRSQNLRSHAMSSAPKSRGLLSARH